MNKLPTASAYVEAVAGDDEYAAAVLDREADAGTVSGPPLSQWTAEAQMLTAIYDRLGEVINAVIAAAGGKPTQPTPAPRPVTAFDRARQRIRQEKHRSLVAEVKQAQHRYATQTGGEGP